jgi:hypothetical protein
VNDLAMESLGDARRGNVLVLVAIVACIALPGALFMTLGPGNFYIELGVAVASAVAALLFAVAVPARVQRRFAAERLAALRALPGFGVDRYVTLLGMQRDGGRLVANVAFAATPSADARARIEHALLGWHLQWDDGTLLAETERLSGKLVFDGMFKSGNAPPEAFTNAAFHAKLEELVRAVGDVAKLAVDIVD